MKRSYIMLAALLTGCSPYAYEAEISKFGSAVAVLDDATSSISNEVVSAPKRTAPWIYYQYKTSRVHLTKECIDGKTKVPGKKKCTLVHQGDRLDTVGSTSENFAEGTRKFVSGLANYAKALVAISKASDRAAFDKAGAELTAAVTSFVAPLAPAFVPTSTLSILTIGSALDYRRLRQMRASVFAVNEKLQSAKPELTKLFSALKGAHYTSEYIRVREIERARNSARSDSERRLLTTELLLGVGELEQLRNADPDKMVNQLVNSHELLAEALRSRSRGSTEIFKAIDEFAQAATQLRDAIRTAK